MDPFSEDSIARLETLVSRGGRIRTLGIIGAEGADTVCRGWRGRASVQVWTVEAVRSLQAVEAPIGAKGTGGRRSAVPP